MRLGHLDRRSLNKVSILLLWAAIISCLVIANAWRLAVFFFWDSSKALRVRFSASTKFMHESNTRLKQQRTVNSETGKGIAEIATLHFTKTKHYDVHKTRHNILNGHANGQASMVACPQMFTDLLLGLIYHPTHLSNRIMVMQHYRCDL